MKQVVDKSIDKAEDSQFKINRYFTTDLKNGEVYDLVNWHQVDAKIIAVDGAVIFDASGLEFPTSWSQNAVNIVAQKYFSPEESSLKDMVGRVVKTIKEWGVKGGYFGSIDPEVFADELTYLLISQRASFNSPVWFNIGLPHRAQQSSACFILSVEDSLTSILNWVTEEGVIFKGGSGAGVNLSNIRGSTEELSGGGVASGPVSFMRGADASAGAIRSGGTTRRAAKMVVLDDNHPDIEEFVWCKATEEKKSWALEEAGFQMGVDGNDKHSIQFQNANNSVRLSDEFFDAVKNEQSWNLLARTTGEVVKTIDARSLLNDIAQAAWECADPGVQYDSTINRWHTTPNAGRISASNPCSEYFHLDNSACNLASLNLLAFNDEENGFDVEGFRHAVALLILAQDILVSFSDYPNEAVGDTARAYRQLGLGYTNLGALIMSMGLAYDSQEARSLAASITALMTGQAYLTSAELAGELGVFEGYAADSQNMLDVLGMHRDALSDLPSSSEIFEEAHAVWDRVIHLSSQNGVRNSQVTVLAPTGTISFMMDCDTTGIEPDLALVKTKQLVGGGSMSITNQSVERALVALGYESYQDISNHIFEYGTVEGSNLAPEHHRVFDCAIGENPISPEGHISMMATVQPFISGGISKTVNLPSTATAQDIADLIISGHELGIKALAVYRDNSKVSQPLSAKSQDKVEGKTQKQEENAEQDPVPVRKPSPRVRNSRTFEFTMSGCKGYVTVGEYTDGTPCEIFIRVSKQGSTLAGTMDAFAISISHGLQYGVPISSFIKAFIGMRFEPTGVSDDAELRFATSIIDYIFRRLALMYLTYEERIRLNIYTNEEKNQLTLPIQEVIGGVIQEPQNGNGSLSKTESKIKPSQQITENIGIEASIYDPSAPICVSCGYHMVRAGSCYACTVCGATSGCS